MKNIETVKFLHDVNSWSKCSIGELTGGAGVTVHNGVITDHILEHSECPYGFNITYFCDDPNDNTTVVCLKEISDKYPVIGTFVSETTFSKDEYRLTKTQSDYIRKQLSTGLTETLLDAIVYFKAIIRINNACGQMKGMLQEHFRHYITCLSSTQKIDFMYCMLDVCNDKNCLKTPTATAIEFDEFVEYLNEDTDGLGDSFRKITEKHEWNPEQIQRIINKFKSLDKKLRQRIINSGYKGV